MSREIEVWGDWQELDGPARMGHLRSSLTRGKEVFSFCQHGAQSGQDLEELWRRIVFSIAVRNTDDHLRNHGFLLTDAGWMLSPAYDLNADPDGTGLSLNVSETDNALSFELALEVAPYFRLRGTETGRRNRELLRHCGIHASFLDVGVQGRRHHAGRTDSSLRVPTEGLAAVFAGGLMRRARTHGWNRFSPGNSLFSLFVTGRATPGVFFPRGRTGPYSVGVAVLGAGPFSSRNLSLASFFSWASRRAMRARMAGVDFLRKGRVSSFFLAVARAAVAWSGGPRSTRSSTSRTSQRGLDGVSFWLIWRTRRRAAAGSLSRSRRKASSCKLMIGPRRFRPRSRTRRASARRAGLVPASRRACSR